MNNLVGTHRAAIGRTVKVKLIGARSIASAAGGESDISRKPPVRKCGHSSPPNVFCAVGRGPKVKRANLSIIIIIVIINSGVPWVTVKCIYEMKFKKKKRIKQHTVYMYPKAVKNNILYWGMGMGRVAYQVSKRHNKMHMLHISRSK